MSDPKSVPPESPTDAIAFDALPAVAEGDAPAPKPPRLEPTRYGDWELNGKCVDF